MSFRPMLAGKAELANLRYPLMASPKLDGVRAVAKDGTLLSRSLKPIANTITRERFSDYQGCDGELVVGSPTASDVYRKTASGVNTIDGNPGAKFFVFDRHDIQAEFSARFQSLPETEGALIRLPHMWVENEEGLLTLEQKWLSLGFEGAMLRDPRGKYKHGRSTAREGWLLKLKRFEDSEAVVLDMTELLHNANEAETNELGLTKRSSHKENKVPMGVMGNLVVKDVATGVIFEIGTGFTQEDRAKMWAEKAKYLGAIVKYKYFAVGVKDKPRHPVFLGIRSREDM